MRILKRNLAFMLAMIMALSLTAFAGYEDYADVEEITYVEAIDVLTELGIVEGIGDELVPEGNLTRGQAAKLIAYTMLGKKAADALQADVAPFTDVPTYLWSAGYIEYCADQGIIGGMGDGTFAPEKDVTASELAKMLLCAVGYGQNGEFTGASWDSTVNSLATKLGVFDENLDVVFAEAVTREEAMLYVFNTLTGVMKVTYSADADEYYVGTVFNSKDEDKFDMDETLGAKLYDLNTKTGEDDFGREGYFWTKNNKKITGLYGKEADAVYTTCVKSGTIYADLDLDEKTMATVVHNGDDVFEFQLKKDSKTHLSKNADEICGNGVLVEAYVYGDDVKLIVIDTYLAKVTEKTEDDEVVVDVYYSTTNVEEEVFETSDIYAEGDYVLVTLIDGEIVTMMPANTVEGKLTKDAVGYVEIDDEKISNAKKISKHATVYEKTHNVDMIALVDEYGYLLGLVEAATADLTEGYVLVLDSQFEDEMNESARVKVMYMESGDVEVLSMPTRYTKNDNQFKGPRGKWIGENDEFTYTSFNGNTATHCVTEATPVANGFYGYYMTEDEQIVLVDLLDTKAKEEYNVYNAGYNMVVADETQALKFGARTDLVLTSKTVLNLVSTNGVETVEGYKNIEINEDDVDALIVYSGVNAKEIFVVDGSLVDDEIYAYWAGRDSDFYHDADGTEIRLYHDGEFKWYNLSDNELKTISAVNNCINELTAENEDGKGVYVLTVEGTNDLVALDKVASITGKLTVEDTEETYFEDTNGNKHYYADPVYIYDVTADGEEATIREHDIVVVVKKTYNDRDLVKYAFIVDGVDNTEGNDDNVTATLERDGTTANKWWVNIFDVKAGDVLKVVVTKHDSQVPYQTYHQVLTKDTTKATFNAVYDFTADMTFEAYVNNELVLKQDMAFIN